MHTEEPLAPWDYIAAPPMVERRETSREIGKLLAAMKIRARVDCHRPTGADRGRFPAVHPRVRREDCRVCALQRLRRDRPANLSLSCGFLLSATHPRRDGQQPRRGPFQSDKSDR
jgi:hypothetical protein